MSWNLPITLRRTHRVLLAAVAFSLACGPRYAPAAGPAPRDEPLKLERTDHLRVLLIGDTGEVNEDMAAVHAAVKAEKKDLILALGDLVYPEAPPCPSGRLSKSALKVLEHKVGGTLLGMGAPVLLVLGNHDVRHGRDKAREDCILHYAASEPELVMPDVTWTLDAGVVSIVGLNTNALDDTQAKLAAGALRAAKGWTLFAGHHVVRTYHDKRHEDRVRPWLARHGLAPDIFANAHAHIMQLGVYDGLVSVTSGSTALPRPRPECPPECGDGQRFGTSQTGYAVLDFTPARVEITFHNTTGKVLHRWTHTKPAGTTAPKRGKP